MLVATVRGELTCLRRGRSNSNYIAVRQLQVKTKMWHRPHEPGKPLQPF